MKTLYFLLLCTLCSYSVAYERTLEVEHNSNMYNIFNADIVNLLPKIDKFLVTIQHTDNADQAVKVTSLKVLFEDHKSITVKDFSTSTENSNVALAYAPFLIFRNAAFSVNLDTDVGIALVSISVNEGYADTVSSPLYMSFSSAFTDITHNPVADTVTTKVNGKRVNIKLRKYPVQIQDTDNLQIPVPVYFIADVSGHGIEDFQLEFKVFNQTLQNLTASDVAISLTADEVLDADGNVTNLWVFVTTKNGGFGANLFPFEAPTN